MIHKRETEERRSVEAGETEYQANILFTSFETRVFNILVGLLCAKIFRQITGMDVPYGVLPVFYLWLATSVAYLVLIKVCGTKRKKCAERLHFSYYFPATVYVTLLVHYLGGAGWVAFIFYFFDLVYANVLLERAKGIIVSVMIAVSYLTLVSLEYTGIVAPCRIFPDTWAAYDNLRYLLVTNVMVVGAVFFLMSYSTGLFSSMKQDREYRLIESKNRFMAKSRQLEEIARDLNSKIAENRYLKRAAMGYIEKKEKELELVRKDLEDQIEQLRRTQRSMFFMIKDLN